MSRTVQRSCYSEAKGDIYVIMIGGFQAQILFPCMEASWRSNSSDLISREARSRSVSFKVFSQTEVCPMTSPGCSKLPCGQMCLYKLTGSEGMSVTGTHTTPVQRYVYDLISRPPKVRVPFDASPELRMQSVWFPASKAFESS